MKKRSILLLAFLLVLALALGAWSSAQESQSSDRGSESATEQTGTQLADLYFENGAIYTADTNNSIVEALAVQDGKIVFAGSAADGAMYKESAKEVVDLQGKMMMPGIIDGHLHSESMDYYDFLLNDAIGEEEIIKIIRDYVAAHPEQETYYGYGLTVSNFESEEESSIGPKKQRLDEISDKPILIYSFDGHLIWLNTAAFELLNITKDTPTPKGGTIAKDENGELWGILQDAAMALTMDYPVNQEKKRVGLENLMHKMNALGVTTIMTPSANGFFMVPLDIYKELEDADKLTMRVRVAPVVTEWGYEEDLEEIYGYQEKYNSELFQIHGVKLFLDGVVDNETALLLEPYADKPGYHGEAGWDPAKLKLAITGARDLGLPVHYHAIGDAAVRMGLDAIEEVYGDGTFGEYRNAMTHLQLVAPEDMKRFADLNVIAVADPFWHQKTPVYQETKSEIPLGEERSEKTYPMRSFLNAGVKLVFASDFPVTSDPNPFHAIELGITRTMIGLSDYEGVLELAGFESGDIQLWPEECLTLTEMLRGYTIDAAYAIYEEDHIGSLEVGKSADLIVLDQNLFKIEPSEIHDTKVLNTYLQGKEIYGTK